MLMSILPARRAGLLLHKHLALAYVASPDARVSQFCFPAHVSTSSANRRRAHLYLPRTVRDKMCVTLMLPLTQFPSCFDERQMLFSRRFQ